MRVRKIRCPGCGAPKVTPHKTAYVYCDYCGRLMDWDFQVACQTAGSAKPGPKYEALLAYHQTRMTTAKLAGDRAALAACQREIYAQLMIDCPAMYSPRLGDPVYREAMLVRTIHAAIIRELDPRCVAADAAVTRTVRNLAWEQPGGVTRCRADTFWAMYEAVVEADRVVKACVLEVAELPPDPDETPPELSAVMRDSIIVQGWLPYLDAPNAAALLERTRLSPEYETLADLTLLKRFCGHCGAEFHTVEGAHRGVCEGCGHTATLGTPGKCSHCGGGITFPVGRAATRCDHCQAEARLMTELY